MKVIIFIVGLILILGLGVLAFILTVNAINKANEEPTDWKGEDF